MHRSDLYSTGHVARLLGLTEPQLNNHLRRGNVPPVPPGPGGRRLWSAADVERAREALAAHTARTARSKGGEVRRGV
jgi:DNA-binding transcriptional MerR regulator